MKNIFLATVGMLLAANVFAGDSEGLVSKASKYTVAETMEKFEAVLKSKGMTIFAHVDHSGEAEKVGLKMQPAKLLIFGNPKGGTPLMVASPAAAIDLPLKALVWQDAEGHVWLAYNTTSYIKQRHHIEGMDPQIKNLDALLDSLTDQAVK